MPYDLQAENYDYVVAIEWRMNIQTKQNKPHRKHTSIAQEFTVLFTIIIYGVAIVYIGRILMHGI